MPPGLHERSAVQPLVRILPHGRKDSGARSLQRGPLRPETGGQHVAQEHATVLHAAVQAGAQLRLSGPGTGLGVAAIDDGRLLASEGGHVAFAPLDADMLGLWQYLHGDSRRVTNEMVVSGNGLVACYRYCLHVAHGIAPELMAPAIVVKRALEEQDPVAQRALALFARCFGAVAGDLALSFLARGGVYLAGGITARVLPALQAPGFIEAFNAKAEHAGLAAGMPVFAVLAEDIGLRGALSLAAHAR